MDQIRPRAESDLPALASALRLVAVSDGYPMHWPEDPESWLRSKDVLGAWVAERDGDLIGHVVLRRPHGNPPARMWSAVTGQDESRCALVSRLFVTPAGRGLGLGRELLDTACGEARRLGVEPVLDVLATNGAVGFYERLGWTLLGVVEDPFFGDPPQLLHCYVAPPAPLHGIHT